MSVEAPTLPSLVHPTYKSMLLTLNKHTKYTLEYKCFNSYAIFFGQQWNPD